MAEEKGEVQQLCTGHFTDMEHSTSIAILGSQSALRHGMAFARYIQM